MTTDEARKQATQIVKESDCIVRLGSTNGRTCFHLKLLANAPGGPASTTIYDSTTWQQHPWNKTNKRKKDRDEGS
jgi:hypothetical protein